MLEGAKVLEKSSSPNAKIMVKGQQMMMDGEKGMQMEMKK